MMSAQMSDNACVLFDLTVPVKVGAYVFTTGGDTAGNLQVVPVSWYLYATNDKNAAEAMRQDGASAQDVYSNYMWTKLDYVENGGIKDTNWTANGYEIDPNEQQHSYRYFCLVICSTRGETLQLGEFELYSK